MSLQVIVTRPHAHVCDKHLWAAYACLNEVELAITAETSTLEGEATRQCIDHLVQHTAHCA